MLSTPGAAVLTPAPAPPSKSRRVLCDGEFFDIAVTDVVPGDIVVIKSGNATCDMVVVEAHHILLVDDSALTGESIPIIKTALDPTLREVANIPILAAQIEHQISWDRRD